MPAAAPAMSAQRIARSRASPDVVPGRWCLSLSWSVSVDPGVSFGLIPYVVCASDERRALPTPEHTVSGSRRRYTGERHRGRYIGVFPVGADNARLSPYASPRPAGWLRGGRAAPDTVGAGTAGRSAKAKTRYEMSPTPPASPPFGRGAVAVGPGRRGRANPASSSPCWGLYGGGGFRRERACPSRFLRRYSLSDWRRANGEQEQEQALQVGRIGRIPGTGLRVLREGGEGGSAVPEGAATTASGGIGVRGRAEVKPRCVTPCRAWAWRSRYRR